MASLRDFSVRLNAYVKKVEGAGTKAQRAVAMAVMQPLVMSTPVGKVDLWNASSRHSARPGYVGGRARANWHVTVGSADAETTEEVDPSGGKTITNAQGEVDSSTPGEAIYLNNNLTYIVPLNDGHSRQAPAGFVQIAVQHGLEKLRTLKILD